MTDEERTAEGPQVFEILPARVPQVQFALFPRSDVDFLHGAKAGEVIPLWPWGSEFDEPAAGSPGEEA